MQGRIACDVLVVGAGPTGVTLGLLLARAGVSVLVIDREDDIYALPRAAHIDHEVMRIFQEIGIADAVMATTRAAARYDFLTAGGDVLLRFDGADRIGPGGWPAGNMIHQPSIERLLRGAVAGQKTLDLRTGWAWQAETTAGDRIESRVATPSGDVIVSSRFLVGCDGARSPVRGARGIDVDDLQFDEPWLVVDALVHDASRLPQINLQICDPARPTTCVLMGSGRHRWEFMLKPGETAEEISEDASVQKLLAPWNVDGAVTLERKVVYRFHAKVARVWRDGAVFLAGDAAHQMPPFAGQGLCSGLRDAANLAWKLVAVMNGADDSLLDTYQSEREPHVRGIIDTAIMMGRTVCITDPDAARERDARMLAMRAAGGPGPNARTYAPFSSGCVVPGSPNAGAYFTQPIVDSLRLDDVLGAGAWLITRAADGQSTLAGVNAVGLDDVKLAPFREALSAWLDKAETHAVLVRPDRYVFGAGNASVLAQAWAGWTN